MFQLDLQMKNVKNHPERGDKVELRGRHKTGVPQKMDDDTNWCTVKWDKDGPKYCHLFELKKVEND